MEISNKELVLKEITMIIKLDHQCDLSNSEIAKKTYIFIKQKMFLKHRQAQGLCRDLKEIPQGQL